MSIEVHRPLRLVPIERKQPKRPLKTGRNPRRRRWVLRPRWLAGPERLQDGLCGVLPPVRESPQGYALAPRLASPGESGGRVAS